MEVINRMYPDMGQIKDLLEPGPEGPICTVGIETVVLYGQWLQGDFQ